MLRIEHLIPGTLGSDLVDAISYDDDVRKETDRRKLPMRTGQPAIEITQTIRRRVLQYDPETSTAYSTLTDTQLDD